MELSNEVKDVLNKISQYANTTEWLLIKREFLYSISQEYKSQLTRRKDNGDIQLNDFEREIIKYYQSITEIRLKIPDTKPLSNVYFLSNDDIIQLKNSLNKCENWKHICSQFKITLPELRRIYKGELYNEIIVDEEKKFIPSPIVETESEHKPSFIGEKHPCAKLTYNDVVVIKKRLLAGEMPRDIKKDYPVSQQAIEAIKYGKKWKSVPW